MNPNITDFHLYNGPAVYKITNLHSGKFYYGSSVAARTRLSHHKSRLRRGIHSNTIIQNSWNKHGEGAFSFELVLVCVDKRDCREQEQRFIDLHHGNKLCMNIAQDAISGSGTTNANHTDEAKRKIGAYQKGRPKSKEQKARTSKSLMGHTVSQETRDKISKTLKARNKANPIKYRKVTCPHCGKVGGGPAIKRWHFDNCKLKNGVPNE